MLSFLMNHISALVMESLSLLLRPIVDATVFDPWPCQCEAKVMPPMRHLEDRCALASAREADWIELRSKLKPLDPGLKPGVWSASFAKSLWIHDRRRMVCSSSQLTKSALCWRRGATVCYNYLPKNHPQPLNICIFVYFT